MRLYAYRFVLAAWHSASTEQAVRLASYSRWYRPSRPSSSGANSAYVMVRNFASTARWQFSKNTGARTAASSAS